MLPEDLRDRIGHGQVVVQRRPQVGVVLRQDDAVAMLHQAVDVVELTWGGGGLNIIFGACRELQPWRNVVAVEDVYDRVMALMTT